MIVARVEHPQWLSNAYLVAEDAGGNGFFIDGNGLTGELEQRAADDNITITHVLCTHGHADHVVGVEELAARHGVPLLAHAETGVLADGRLADGDTITSGGLTVRELTVRERLSIAISRGPLEVLARSATRCTSGRSVSAAAR